MTGAGIRKNFQHWERAAVDRAPRLVADVLDHLLSVLEEATEPKMPNEPLTLLSLPREIRLIIYTYLFSERYICHWPAKRLGVVSAETPANSLNILQTCTTIHAEALHILNTRTVIRFCIPLEYDLERATLANLRFENLMNVQITTCGPLLETVEKSDRLDENLLLLLSHFASPSTLRSAFSIRLDPGSRRTKRGDSEIIKALGTLTGFKSVVIRFISTPLHLLFKRRKVNPDTPWRDVARIMGPTFQDMRERYEEAVATAVQRLQQGLGEGFMRDLEAKQVLYAREVEFRPRG
ncbi:MAG: hypothetical protein Q9218_001834 [Villophora microphyllina]